MTAILKIKNNCEISVMVWPIATKCGIGVVMHSALQTLSAVKILNWNQDEERPLRKIMKEFADIVKCYC